MYEKEPFSSPSHHLGNAESGHLKSRGKQCCSAECIFYFPLRKNETKDAQ